MSVVTVYDGTADNDAMESSTYVLILHGSGFCFNSATNNKQASPALCDLAPVPTPNVLVYTYGRLGNQS